MKKELLALALVAALPGCGCWRKQKPTDDKTKKMMTDKKKATTNTMKKTRGGGKELMDMQSAY